jgi:hypothetical protein
LPLDVGRRLSFLGYGYSGEDVERGGPWRVTTYWKVLESDPSQLHEPLAIFIHALDDANNVVSGWDGLHVSTESWRPGDLFIQVHTLALPPEIAAGAYRVELGVYSPIDLGRLPIDTGPGEAAAPQNRILLAPITVR